MIVGLVAFFQITAADSLPRITLAEALQRSAKVDPSFAAATGAVDYAEWGRRAAWSAFVLPSVTASTDASKFSTPTFNLGTGQPQDVAVNARLDASYDLLIPGRKLAELSRSRASLDSARASEVQARFDVAYRTESDYYQVLANQELDRVAHERVRRAEEQLVVARARVISGAAVATDSLQLVLELSRARVEQLRQGAALRISRLQLGRRVGLDGPVQAEPLPTLPPGELPLTLRQAIASARATGPRYVAARATEDAADASVRAERSSYLPQLTLSATTAAFDKDFFPRATTRSWLTLQATLPIWNNGQRELALEAAQVSRNVAQALRRDAERGVQRDVTEAYENYSTARATTLLSSDAVVVAKENFRVQETRYRAGATTILDLLAAQIRLAEAEADLVQSRYSARLALAGLEAILGRRIFNDRSSP